MFWEQDRGESSGMLVNALKPTGGTTVALFVNCNKNNMIAYWAGMGWECPMRTRNKSPCPLRGPVCHQCGLGESPRARCLRTTKPFLLIASSGNVEVCGGNLFLLHTKWKGREVQTGELAVHLQWRSKGSMPFFRYHPRLYTVSMPAGISAKTSTWLFNFLLLMFESIIIVVRECWPAPSVIWHAMTGWMDAMSQNRNP